MNPDPGLWNLFRRAARARQAGHSADEVDKALVARGAPAFNALAQQISESVDASGHVASAGLGAAQAATGGLADEAAAGLEAMIPKAGTTFAQRYRALRGTEHEVRGKYPMTAAMADVATSVALPGPAALKLVGKGGSFLARTAKAAGVLGGLGAAEGYARGDEGGVSRPMGAEIGAATGLAAAVAPLAYRIGNEYKRYAMAPLRRALAGTTDAAVEVAPTIAKAATAPVIPKVVEGPPAWFVKAAKNLQMDPAKAWARRIDVPTEGLLGKADAPQGILGPMAKPMSAAQQATLEIPTYLRKSAPIPAPANPLMLTADEAAHHSGAMVTAGNARDAARNAYNIVFTATKDKALAMEAAKRAAAATLGGPGTGF